MVAQIMKLDNPHVSEDQLALFFKMETTEGDAELMIPTADIGKFVQFFAALLIHLEPEGGEITNELYSIPAHGIAFADGETPGTKTLILKIGGYGLAFEIHNSDLARLGDGLTRTLRTLSADDQGKPN